LIGFLAQLFTSLLRCDLSELAGASAKFIKKSLRNLIETLAWGENGAKKRIFSNFDVMNKAILRKRGAIS